MALPPPRISRAPPTAPDGSKEVQRDTSDEEAVDPGISMLDVCKAQSNHYQMGDSAMRISDMEPKPTVWIVQDEHGVQAYNADRAG